METARPLFQGLLVYRDLRHRFSLMYPSDWVQQDLPEDAGGGALLRPPVDEAHTSLLVQARRLKVQVEEADLHELHAGFLDGLRQLPGGEIEGEEAVSAGPLLSFEARHTFRDDAHGGAVRKRWTRLLYQGSAQVTMIAQGETPERFGYWEPMFNTAMRTVKFGDWWAELTGVSWLKSLKVYPKPESKARRAGGSAGAASPAKTRSSKRRTAPAAPAKQS